MPVRDVRVQDRGSFFDDAFFKDSWEDFDTAMQTVLDRFDGHGVRVNQKSRPQCQDIYRKIRTNKIDDDMYASQAIQVTEKDGRFQVVVDVSDFNPTDLQVKVIDEKVVLEGRYDKVSEDGKSSSSKAFYREFMLPPEADIELISTALSKDGILTIRAPRKEGTLPPPKQANTAAAAQFLQNTLNNDHRYTNSPNYPASNKSYIPNSSSYESTEGFDSLPKDVRERLLISDRDSGRGSTSGSPCQSGFSSPAPSEAGSESSRVSSKMEYDTGKRSPFQKPEPPFKVGGPRGSKFGQGPQGPPGPPGVPAFQPPQSQMNVSNTQQPKSCAAVGSGGTASISVKEEDGKRTLTSEKSSLVQQKDGFLESKEIAAEVTEDNSQAARREAITRMMKTAEDPEGRFKKSETADASDVSESCVQQLPDGSVVKVKKSSTSTSNVKISSSTGLPPIQGFNDPSFPSAFGEMPNLVGRGHNLMSQMSSDSVASNMSNFSDMSNFSRFSDRSSNFPDMQSGFPNRGDPFQDRFSNFSGFPNFPPMGQMPPMNMNPQMPQNPQTSQTSKTYSSTSQFSNTTGFDNMKF